MGTIVRALAIGMTSVAISVGGILGSASAATPRQAETAHQKATEFWTKDRIAGATTRDFNRSSNGSFVISRKAANVLSASTVTKSSTSTTTTVLGADWTGGGAVQHTTGKVLFQMGSSYYVCSASVITDSSTTTSTVMTAAHCVYDQATKTWATNWMFIPDYDTQPVSMTANGSFCAQTIYGCWTAQAFTIDKAFASQAAFNQTATYNDFAFVTVGAGGKSGKQLDAVVSAQPVSYVKGTVGGTAWSFGYPAATPFDGKRLIYSRNALKTDPSNANKTYRIASSMTGGSSGGPWFQAMSATTGKGSLISVVSYGYTGTTWLQGPILNSTAKSLATAANGATASKVVG